jgi:hypothetical protein
MHYSFFATSPARRSRRAPEFTLGTALAWLGHDCPATCVASAADMPAEVWFTNVGGGDSPAWTDVLIDNGHTSAPTPPSLVVLADINTCVGRDRIRVHARSASAGAAPLSDVPGPRARPADEDRR